MQGRIIKGIGGFYYVASAGGNIYECRAKGIFRKEKMKPLVGDYGEIEIIDEKEKTGNLVKILPRKKSADTSCSGKYRSGPGDFCSQGTKP